MGSSKLLEFIVALVVGILAVLGALFCIAFLLVEPVRFPPSEEPTVSLSEVLSTSECEPVVRPTSLPLGCRLNGSRTVPISTCSMGTCTCDRDLLTQQTKVCCCRPTAEVEITGAECPVPIPFRNATACGCVSCDSVAVSVVLTVLAVRSRDPIPAAHVFQLGDSSTDNEIFLGLTDNFGRFTTRRFAGEVTLSLMVRAVGYAPQTVGAFNLLPSTPHLTRQVLLMPNMDVVVGMGGDAFNLRLGATLSLSAMPFAFTGMDGGQYEDVVTFQGIVVEASDPDAPSILPGRNFVFFDPDTGTEVTFAALLGLFPGFVDSNGLPLQAAQNGLQLSISLQAGQDLPELFYLTFDPSTGNWTKQGNLAFVEPVRKKRQTTLPPVIFRQSGIPLGTFGIVAMDRGINCYFQARVFEEDGVTPAGPTFVDLTQQGSVEGNQILTRFGTLTDSGQTDFSGLESNAVCLPVACESFQGSGGTISASEGDPTGVSLIPERFPDGTFEDGEEPLVIHVVFAFVEVPLSVPGVTPLPFYGSIDECEAEGEEDNAMAQPTEFFKFNRRAVIEVPEGELCYAKVLIDDCFDSNELVLITINPETNLIEGNPLVIPVTPPPVVTTPPFMTTDTPTTPEATTQEVTTDTPTTPEATTQDATTDTPTTFDFSGDGTDDPFTDPETTPPETTPPETTPPETTPPETTPPETTPPETTPPETTPPPVTTPPGPFVCNAQTSSLRAVCVPYRCGFAIQVSVTPGPGSTRPTVCEVTQRSVVLQSFLFPDTVNQLLVDTTPLIYEDYNNPDLGFYADLTEESVAEARCNAGMGEDSLSNTINLSGPSVTFSCLEE